MSSLFKTLLALSVFHLLRPISAIPLNDLDSEGNPNHFEIFAYACAGHYWFLQKWINEKKRYDLVPPFRTDDHRYIHWEANRWICYKPENGFYFVSCATSNLFDCNEEIVIRYQIVATQSEAWYRRNGTDTNNKNYYHSETLPHRVIFYDIDASEWRISDEYNGNSVYDTCSTLNFFECGWVQTGNTANPTNYPTIPPTRQPTLSPTKPPSNVPTISPSNVHTQSPSNVPTMSPSNIPTISSSNVPTQSISHISYTMSTSQSTYKISPTLSQPSASDIHVNGFLDTLLSTTWLLYLVIAVASAVSCVVCILFVIMCLITINRIKDRDREMVVEVQQDGIQIDANSHMMSHIVPDIDTIPTVEDVSSTNTGAQGEGVMMVRCPSMEECQRKKNKSNIFEMNQIAEYSEIDEDECEDLQYGKCTQMGCACDEYIKNQSKWSKNQCKTCNHKENQHEVYTGGYVE